jgi:hypothetical protein
VGSSRIGKSEGYRKSSTGIGGNMIVAVADRNEKL